MYIMIRLDLHVHYDYTKYMYNTWLCNLGEHMIMPVFLDSETVFTHIIVGTFLAFVSGAHNREQITLITPEKKKSLKKVKTNQNQIIRGINI